MLCQTPQDCEKATLGQHTQIWWNQFWLNPNNNFGPPRQSLIDYVLTYRDKAAPKDISVVDVGSGDGRYALALAQKGIDTSAVELTESGVLRIKNEAQRLNTCVTLYQGDFIPLSQSGNQFDVVFSSGLLEEINTEKDQIEVVRGLQRWTKDSGMLILKYCLEIKDRGIRVRDHFVPYLFAPDDWEVLYFDTEPSLRESIAPIAFENMLRTETIIVVKRASAC